MQLNQFLDATYLKTANQANLTEEENKQKVVRLINESIKYNYKLIMIRAQYISLAKEGILNSGSNVLIGTVIGFHEGTKSIQEKLEEAKKAIDVSADELDFVINYLAFKKGDISLVKNEIYLGTKLCLENNKIIKWIVEVAALTTEEIIVISQLIKKVVFINFGEENAKNIFVKSSTGFYKTENNLPKGATLASMKLILDNAKPLKVKAAGGVKNYEMAIKMVNLGVDRIGTSSPKEIIKNERNINSDY